MKKIFLLMIVFTSISFTQTLIDSYSDLELLGVLYYSGIRSRAQSFTGIDAKLGSAKFYLSKTGSPTGKMCAELFAHTGTYGTSSKPTGDPLAISDSLEMSSVGTDTSLVTFTFSTPYQLVNGTYYVIAISAAGGDSESNWILVGYRNTNETHSGNYSSRTATTWTANSGADLCFYLYTPGTTFTPQIIFIE